MTPIFRKTSMSNLTLYQMTKFTAMTKLKAFADDEINIAKLMIHVFDRVENIVGKGENAGHQHFLLFPQCFQKVSFGGGGGALKVRGLCSKELKTNI